MFRQVTFYNGLYITSARLCLVSVNLFMMVPPALQTVGTGDCDIVY